MSEIVEKACGDTIRVEKSAPDQTKIEMKSYILDDLGALKKKWIMINHKPEIECEW